MKIFFKQFFEKQLRFSPFFYKRLKVIQQLQRLDKAQIENLQEKKFLKLLRKVYHQSHFYSTLYKKHQVKIDQIKSIRDLHLLPVIEKKNILGNQDSIFIGNKLNRFTAKSSGTSGSSVTVYRDYQAVIEEGAYQWAHRMSFGHQPGMKTVVIRGNLNINEKEQYDPFTHTLYLSSYQLNLENAEWYYQRIKQFAPNAIFAYPSSLESLANFFTMLNKHLAVPIIFTSSETLYSYQREKIERIFKSRIIDWYGNAERTIALQEQEDGLYDQLPLYSINEFKEDHIITTSLINSSFPLIRYKVDDIVKLEDGFSQARIGSRVKEIQGRSDDVLILPNGTRVGLICKAFDGIDHILLSQVVQLDLYSIYVNVVVTDKYSQQEEQLLVKQIEENIGKEASYKIRYVTEDEIIKSKSGKFKLIVNKMHQRKEAELESEGEWSKNDIL